MIDLPSLQPTILRSPAPLTLRDQSRTVNPIAPNYFASRLRIDVVTPDNAIEVLRQAVVASPDNVFLRYHLAESLRTVNRPAEAEVEYREAIARAPDNIDLKIGLALSFSQQGKTSMGLVVLETLVAKPHPPARARVAYARVLLSAGEPEEASVQYRRAIEVDPSAADVQLSGQLNIGPTADPLDETEINPEDRDEEIVDGRIRSAWGEDEGSGSNPEMERPTIKFEDVGGMDALKDEIRIKIILPLDHADLYKAYGKAAGGGVLLYGPPGCGKTHLARATAGEIKANFLSVGLNDVLEMWVGNSERNLHALFEQARDHAPCVLFFDEVDALAADRSDLKTQAGRFLINQFLSEMDGIESKNDGVLILAATNAPWHLDPAFRRPGRFDRVLFVPPPDQAARAAILRILCKGKPLKDVDYDQVAKKSDKFSGADLKGVVDLAVEAKLREALKAGGLKPITTKDLLAAAATAKPSTREWFATARNYALYSNQSGIYDDILTYLKLV